ncbi:MAG: SPASM domain-containing protein [Desulfobacteraceae bacterium]|nr:MAG: SPASM domain-containing protein [Desulfobacteraceae bacterium]
MKYRYENFGGIIASEDPPFLAFVDQAYMRGLGLPGSDRWETPNPDVGLLSAPLEVHMAITNRCSAGCPHCYMDSTVEDPGEMTTLEFKRALDILAKAGVFHVALGGGEAIERSDLFDIAAYARQIGLVPNLTVSGRGITPGIAKQMTVFGQVNLSMDGVGEDYEVFRGNPMFDLVDQAISSLVDAAVPTGINCVLGKRNFDGLEALFAYAGNKGLNEIEILRFKPAGRAANRYMDESTTFEQNIQLIPHLAGLSEKTGVTAKIDCSFVPMLCYHNPPKEALHSMATYGCEAGNVLLGVRSNGEVAGCSFLSGSGLSVFDFDKGFSRNPDLERMTGWAENAPAPCKNCDYLEICKGGCRAVSLAMTGDLWSPDPDCPKIVELRMET